MPRSARGSFGLFLIAAVVLGVCLGGSAWAAVEIKIAHVNAKTHPVGVGLEAFKEQVEKASSGRIRVKAFHNAALGGDPDIIQGVQLGNIEMGTANGGSLAPFVPEYDIFSLPFMFRDEEHLHKVVDGELGKVLTAAAAKKMNNMKIMGFSTSGQRQIETRMPVRSVADMKGLKIRTVDDPGIVEVFKMFGAMPTPISFGEVYTALQSGVVDGCETSFISWVKSRFIEVAKYGIQVNYMDNGRVFFASQKFFDKLSPEDRKIVSEAMQSTIQMIRKEYVKQAASIVDEAKALGGTIIVPDMPSFRKAAEPMFKKFKPTLGDEWIERIRKS